MVPSLRRYLVSCGLLLVPVLLWNVAFYSALPPAFAPSEFGRDIPWALVLLENALRVPVFVLPFLMPLEVTTQADRRAMGVFVSGTLLYFASWVALMVAPDSAWSTSAVGFLAPAYTPVVWLVGIALLGRRLSWGTFYRRSVYLVLSLAFLSAHIAHASIVYSRND